MSKNVFSVSFCVFLSILTAKCQMEEGLFKFFTLINSCMGVPRFRVWAIEFLQAN